MAILSQNNSARSIRLLLLGRRQSSLLFTVEFTERKISSYQQSLVKVARHGVHQLHQRICE